MNIIDLNSPPPNHRYTVSVNREDTPAELAVRLIKELVIFFLAVVFVGAIYWLSYDTVINPTAGAEEKKWAMSVLSAGAAGLVGYLVRK